MDKAAAHIVSEFDHTAISVTATGMKPVQTGAFGKAAAGASWRSVFGHN
jgi:hypothetical protein